MSIIKNQLEKTRLHPRNKNRERYDLNALILAKPELKAFIIPNKSGQDSVDFSSPKAVKLLNQALLSHYYGIKNWDFPDENLCPPIPGRADYLHYIADLLASTYFGTVPTGENIVGLDVGTGASCIYPILGTTEYGWRFIASDIDQKSIDSSEQIIESNESLSGKITCRFQKNPRDVFFGIVGKEEKIDFTMCNPPFHASKEEALKGSLRKVKNLTGKSDAATELNFSGISNELICDGGELKFIQNMVRESQKFAGNCFWFTTLVSKQSNVEKILKLLHQAKVVQLKNIPMGTGNKTTRIIAWSFLDSAEQKAWRETKRS